VKRTIISAAVLALGLAGAGVSLADPGDGGFGFNGNNDYGLCTAFMNHNDGNGQDDAHAGPFQDLQPPEEARDAQGQAYDSTEEYCTDVLAGDGSPGNSEHGHGGKG
jgi:hypothetical protein